MAPPRFRPSCHRCGAALDDAPGASCPQCIERPRRSIRDRLLRLVPRRPRTLLVLVAVAAFATAWGVHARRARLADDSGEFFTHEQSAEYAAFQKAAVLMHARKAEQKAAAGGPDQPYWADQAADAHGRAAALARQEADYRWRAYLKQHFREGGW